jgi:prophage DNA circulation protein
MSDNFLKEYLDQLVGSVARIQDNQEDMVDSISELKAKVSMLSEAFQGTDEKKKKSALLNIYMQSSRGRPSAEAH